MKNHTRASFIQFLDTTCTTYKNQPLFISRPKIHTETITYATLSKLLCQTESWLVKNTKPQDKIIILGYNSPEYSVLLLSCLAFSRIAVPLDINSTEAFINNVISEVKPTYIFVSREKKHLIPLSKKIQCLALEDFFSLISSLANKNTHLSSLTKKYSTDTIGEIIFTSGTTSTPKGVLLRGSQLIASVKSLCSILPNLEHAKILSLLPLSHVFEQTIGLLVPLVEGGTIYYLKRVNSQTLIEAFNTFKPTHQIMVPQMIRLLWNRIEDKVNQKKYAKLFPGLVTLSSYLPMSVRKLIFTEIHALFGGNLQLIASGGAPLDPVIAQNFINIGIPIIEGYGATEVSAIATVNTPEDNQLGSVGKPIPGVEISLNEEGEILIKGNGVTDGYYNNSVATKKVFTTQGYKTGDIGNIDEHGRLHVLGRSIYKIVLSNGENVYVEDIERTIKQDPRVKDACVIPKKEADGDVVHAVFLLKEISVSALPEIVADINKQLATKQQIRSYSIWEDKDFPRTPTLKLQREAIRAFVLQNKPIEKKQTKKQSLESLKELLARVTSTPLHKIKDDDYLASDLGMDSLGRAEFCALAREYLGLEIDESNISEKTKVKDVPKLFVDEQKSTYYYPYWRFTKWGELFGRTALSLLGYPLHKLFVSFEKPLKPYPSIPKGSIVIFNHAGLLDIMCVFRILHEQGHTQIMSNAMEGFWKKGNKFQRIIEIFGAALPLYKNGPALIKTFQLNDDLLQKGYCLAYAPQGRLQFGGRKDGFKTGLGYLVKELNQPVSIVKLIGYEEIWPAKASMEQTTTKDLLPKKRGTVQIKVSQSYNKQWDTMSIQEITQYLEDEYNRL